MTLDEARQKIAAQLAGLEGQQARQHDDMQARAGAIQALQALLDLLGMVDGKPEHDPAPEAPSSQ
jgi:hypothetical protein